MAAHPVASGLLSHLLTVIGFLLAVFAIARLMSQRKQPGNTFAWLLAIAFIPYLGVPLYLLLGGRKIRKLAERKARLCPTSQGAVTVPDNAGFAARVFTRDGACPPIGGNRVRFLTTGEDSFATLEKGILEAKESIHLMTFILGHDEVGRRIVQLLARRARAGVKVRLLLDALGCFRTSGRFCDPIREAGGEVVKFMPVFPLQTRGSANLRNHRKIAIIDHQFAAVGGRNLALEYMGPQPLRRRWRDLGAVIQGPAVRQIEEIFLADWAYASGDSLLSLQRDLPPEWPRPAGNASLQVVASGPDVTGDPLYEGILSLVQQAQRSVWIVTPYFIPDEVLQRSLMVQARAGLDVRIVVPARSNHRITDLARRHHLRELQKAGVKVLLYQSGMNHAKLLFVDGETTLFGSANMDLRSLFVNFEIGLVAYSAEEASVVRSWCEEVFAQSRPLPEKPRARRFFPAIGEEIARLLAPLL
ncbi:cardiolipin synthase [Oleiharenicola lentus]|uniref:Cardiolipin synthase n=1 Tax=Oleiharenicola lentus TaxID=2508720 RepID=A0A4Q1CCY1_9BACT|nr:cardiolipin synthase [Oleiharenicola lentus]RXK56984.1 cardiolipin synthase [Oleiharenicola lentus]